MQGGGLGLQESRTSDEFWMLKLIYPRVVNLDEYLEVWLNEIIAATPSSTSAAAIASFGGPTSYLSRLSDSPAFKQMLKETVVAYCPPGAPVPDEEHAPLPRHASLRHRSSVADLLDRVVKTLLRSSSTGQASHAGGNYTAQGGDPRRNVLSLGCCVAGPQATSELLSVQGVACAFPNTTLNVIRSPPWEQLAARIGDDLMFALFRQHALLQRLPNRCFMQLAGRPIPDLCRQQGLTAGSLSALSTHSSTAMTDRRRRIPGLPEEPSLNQASAQRRNRHGSSLSNGISTTTTIGGISKAPSAEELASTSAADKQASQGALQNRTADRIPSKDGAQSRSTRGGPKRPGQHPTVLLPHHRILYSSTFVRKSGFPRGHYLCPDRRTRSPTQRPSNSPDNGDTESSAAARRLLLDVFCVSEACGRQSHGGAVLQGVSTGMPSLQGVAAGSTGDGRAGKVDGGERGKDERRRKLPKRLRKAAPIFAAMIARARRCNFGRLLEAHCPLPEAIRRSRAPGSAVKRKYPRGTERNSPPTVPEPRGRDISTAREGKDDNTGLVGARSQTCAAKGEDTTVLGVKGKGEEGGGGNISTADEVCSQSPAACIPMRSNGVSAHTGDDEGGDWTLAASGAAKRRRLLGDDGRDVVGIRSDDENERSDRDATPASEGDDAASDVTVLDIGADVEARDDFAVTRAVAPPSCADPATQDSRFSLDPDKKFMEMATERRRVADFVCQACHRIFPTDLWGSRRNMVHLVKAVERFIGLRRHESMSVQEVTIGMRTSEFRWMALEQEDVRKVPPGAGQKRRRGSPPSELAKRVQLLEALVLWAFKDVVVPLVRSHFYATECEASSQEVFFFRKPVWAKFRAASVGHLTARQYRRINGSTEETCTDGEKRPQQPGRVCTPDASTMPKRRSRSMASEENRGDGTGLPWAFPASTVRLVPKANGVRAITNLSKRSWVDRDRVQWAKGGPLLAPRGAPGFQSTASNSSAQTSGGGASKEAPRASGRDGSVLSGETAGATTDGGGQGNRRRQKASRGVRTNSGARILLPSINMQLSNAFHVLKHEYLSKPSLAGAGVFGLDDVFARIKPFISRNLRPLLMPREPNSNHVADRRDGPRRSEEDSASGERKPKLRRYVAAGKTDSSKEAAGGSSGGYPCESPTGLRRKLPALFFASVDIKHCYDSIDQAKLLDIIRPLIASEDYVIQKYAKAHLYKALGRVQVSHVKEAVALGDLCQFRAKCEELADESFDAIFTDQVVYGIVSREEVLEMIEEHVTNAVVEVPAAGGPGRGAFYRQAVGIPQGSVLSVLLCNFFFGHIEEKLLGKILAAPTPPLPVSKARSSVAAGRNGCSRRFARSSGNHPPGSRRHDPCPFLCPAGNADDDAGTDDGSGARKRLGKAPRCELPAENSFDKANGGHCCHPTRGEQHVSTDTLRGGQSRREREGSRCAERSIVNGLRRGPGIEERGSCPTPQTRPFPDPEGDCTLLRQVDDFLLVTTSKAKAEAFVRVMHDHVRTSEWGFGVHEGKTVVNFDMTVEGGSGASSPRQVRKIDGKMFPWCGLRFNTQTCEVMANYSRYSQSSVSESVTVESNRAGACLMAKMKRFLSPKCHALMLDEGELGINSRHTVLLNVYEIFVVCAAKTAASALRLPRGPAGNSSLLSKGARETTGYAYNLIQSRSNRRKGNFGTSKAVRCVCKVNRFEVTWLGLYAFRQVFSAFSVKHAGFTQPASDVAEALLGAEQGEELQGKRRQTGQGVGDAARESGAEKSKGRRRLDAVARLRRIVRNPDALELVRTLTTDAVNGAKKK